MDKEQLIAFLKENLSVSVVKLTHWGYDADQVAEIEVKLMLGDEVISSESCTIKG